MGTPLISLLTDFGLETAPAVCRGVMLTICPNAWISDLTHSVRKYAVRDGAFLLWSAVPYQPVGVHVAVVGPGWARSGGRSRSWPSAVTDWSGRTMGCSCRPPSGSAGSARSGPRATLELHLAHVSSTFHGRDIFSPVGAHLAAGVPFADVGPKVDPPPS